MSDPVVEEPIVSKDYRRYVSIDFLRGSAIFAMVILHTISDTLDVDFYISKLDQVGVINLVALLVLPFIGGLAGLFLMTSAMGNIIAMRRNLEKGYSPNSVIAKQVLGGTLVVIFAMVGEATIGYHGFLGSVLHNLDDFSAIDYEVAKWRAFEIETLHTIGWAIIVNGIVQGLLAKRYDIFNDMSQIIRAYWILIIIVLILTPLVWFITSALLPGYPFDIDPTTGRQAYLPVIGVSPWYRILLLTFINPLAAPLEPIFPYLATSFMGSIVGLQLSQPQDALDRGFVRRYFKLGLAGFVIGFIGVIVVLIHILNERGLDAMLEQYRLISYHRRWVASQGAPGGWFWQYITLNAAALMIVSVAIRITEYRGKSAEFAKSTTAVRRFGFIALTVYITQWIYFLCHLLVTVILGFQPYQRVPWLASWLILALALLSYHFIMKAWEKHGYIGSLEWMISGIANRLARVKKQSSFSSLNGATKWYRIGRLKVDEIFYNPIWINFPSVDPLADERQLIKYLSIGGFFLFPFSFIGFQLIRGYSGGESLWIYKLLSGLGMLFAIIWVPLSFMLSLQDFGIVL